MHSVGVGVVRRQPCGVGFLLPLTVPGLNSGGKRFYSLSRLASPCSAEDDF